MKKLIIISLIFMVINSVYSQRFEPMLGRSGSVLGLGDLRLLGGWASDEKNNAENSRFNLGVDIGTGLNTELQSHMDYNSVNSSKYRWTGWTELLKIRIFESANGPVWSFGIGARIPLRWNHESLGLITGLYNSSSIKDLDLDLNLGFNPYLTYYHSGINSWGKEIKVRPPHYINLDVLLGYKLVSFFKLNAGFEMRHFISSTVLKQEGADNKEITYTYEGGTQWTFLLGARMKPQGWPLLLDSSISFDTTDNPYRESDWQFKLGLQILPQSPNADW